MPISYTPQLDTTVLEANWEQSLLEEKAIWDASVEEKMKNKIANLESSLQSVGIEKKDKVQELDTIIQPFPEVMKR